MSHFQTPSEPHWRGIEETDVNEVHSIEARVYGDPWTPKLLLDSLSAPLTHTLGAFEEGGSCLAYAIYQIVFLESHILNLAVRPESARQGLGSKLLSKVMEHCEREGAKMIYLEVRPSNEAARALYKKHGFLNVSVRERYYPNGEAAVIMARELK